MMMFLHINNLIEKLNLQDKILLINKFIPNEEVAKYYNAADVLILPYRSATQSAVLNVAYSFRKPVIVTNVGGLSEFVVDNSTGIIVKPDSPEEIAEGVNKFFNSTGNINYKSNIENYLSGDNFSKLPELFEQILTSIDSSK